MVLLADVDNTDKILVEEIIEMQAEEIIVAEAEITVEVVVVAEETIVAELEMQAEEITTTVILRKGIKKSA